MSPALTSDDLPQPDGPWISPIRNVLSAWVSSMRVFQKWTDSGSPSVARLVGKQFEEEVFVLGNERPKTPRDDLNCIRFNDFLAGLVPQESRLAHFYPTLRRD